MTMATFPIAKTLQSLWCTIPDRDDFCVLALNLAAKHTSPPIGVCAIDPWLYHHLKDMDVQLFGDLEEANVVASSFCCWRPNPSSLLMKGAVG